MKPQPLTKAVIAAAGIGTRLLSQTKAMPNELLPMIETGSPYYACEIQNGKRHDSGNKLEYLNTVVELALNSDDIGPDSRRYLEEAMYL